MAHPHRDSRRSWLLSTAASGLGLLLPRGLGAQPAGRRLRPSSPPVWTGFGLNGSSGEARFGLTRDHVLSKTGKDLSHPDAFGWLREPLRRLLEAQNPQPVSFRTEVAFGESALAGFAHDYEMTVGARVERDGDNANTLFIFMSGVGLILAYAPATGWRITSSFPFVLRFERPGKDLRNTRTIALGYMDEAYKGYCAAYVNFLSRFGRWDRGFSTNYFARVTRAAVHPDAARKLAQLGADKFFSRELVGFSASASICDNLGIPLLPYQDNDALSKRYATKFTDAIAAQDVLEIPDADLKFEVLVRDIEKEVIPSRQKGITILRRQLVLNFRVLDEYAQPRERPIFQTIAVSAPDDDKMPFGSTEDDTAERDMVFYDRLLTRTLAILLKGVATKDAGLLSQVGVSLDKVGPAIPRLMELCTKTI